MLNGTPHRVGNHRTRFEHEDPSKRQLAKMLDEVIYFIRTREGQVKIGYTRDLATRHTNFGSWDCILAFYRGNPDDERREHETFDQYALGHERFTPGPLLIDRINEIRTSLGVPPIAWG